ncbi:MAG: chorismate synthase [Alloprevotella sp.]|nr:chorismate synthase [Alloprevotella sp.]
MNTFGNILRLTTFGESHGEAMGGVIDGFPAGIAIDLDEVQRELSRRRPGQSSVTTARNEADTLEVLSGIYEGRTTGTPIGFIVKNTNQRSADYGALSHIYRPSHADYTYDAKYGIRDPRGGGRASARETLCRVVGGAFAKQALRIQGIQISAFTSQIGDIKLEPAYRDLNLTAVDASAVRCPDPATAQRMEKLAQTVRSEGDSLGGVVTCIIQGCPAGLGEPVYGKFSASLASAMMGINAAKGFEIGDGFALSEKLGSEVNDTFYADESGCVRTRTNHSGGIQGGITNGEDVVMRIAFKPVPTILKPQATLNDAKEAVTLAATGRHDPCVVPRAVPVVEAMAALCTLDFLLLDNATQLFSQKTYKKTC